MATVPYLFIQGREFMRLIPSGSEESKELAVQQLESFRLDRISQGTSFRLQATFSGMPTPVVADFRRIVGG
jgi:hypothetical protein